MDLRKKKETKLKRGGFPNPMPLREWLGVEAPAGLTGILWIPNPHLSPNISKPLTLWSTRFPTLCGIRVNMDILLPTKNHLTTPTPQPLLFRDDHHHCSFIRPYFHEISLKQPTGCSSSKQTRCFSLTHSRSPKTSQLVGFEKCRFHLKTLQFIQ